MTKGASPTALNKRGTKVEIDGYTFDSQKEADFYVRYIRDCGLPFKVHPSYVLQPTTELATGRLNKITYAPDFVIYDEYGEMLHVYDVKNSFGQYGIDQGNKLRFKMFAAIWKIPVEAVVLRVHDFKVIAQGVTKQRPEKDPLIAHDVYYDWREATGYKEG